MKENIDTAVAVWLKGLFKGCSDRGFPNRRFKAVNLLEFYRGAYIDSLLDSGDVCRVVGYVVAGCNLFVLLRDVNFFVVIAKEDVERLFVVVFHNLVETLLTENVQIALFVVVG